MSWDVTVSDTFVESHLRRDEVNKELNDLVGLGLGKRKMLHSHLLLHLARHMNACQCGYVLLVLFPYFTFLHF